MNSVILSGFISKDFKPNETNKMGNSSIAVKRPYPFSKKDANGNEVPDYINLRFIGEKNVIRAAKWLVKGAAVTIEGVICRDTWKTTEGKWGENNYILVKSWEFQTTDICPAVFAFRDRGDSGLYQKIGKRHKGLCKLALFFTDGYNGHCVWHLCDHLRFYYPVQK